MHEYPVAHAVQLTKNSLAFHEDLRGGSELDEWEAQRQEIYRCRSSVEWT